MLRELDSRQSDNMLVRLMWRPDNNTLTIIVNDVSDSGNIVLTVEDIPASDRKLAFDHPFGYSRR